LPAPVAADCINFGMQYERDAQDIGVLLTKNGESTIRAMTGPRYGRVWNDDVIAALMDRFGDGVTGDFRVPGVFGKAVQVDRENTTLYAGDRDMFVFLADEINRIELPGRSRPYIIKTHNKKGSVPIFRVRIFARKPGTSARGPWCVNLRTGPGVRGPWSVAQLAGPAGVRSWPIIADR
jgi:hypothetical protein